MKRSLAAGAVLATALMGLTAACGSSGKKASADASPSASMSQQMSTDPSMSMPATSAPPSSAAPAVIGSGPAIGDVYSHDGVGMFTAATRNVPYRIYVPNHGDGTVSVIDPVAKKVIDTFRTAPGSQHVIPAWDLKTLYSANDEGGNSLTPISPITGKPQHPGVRPVQHVLHP
jgi:YVTN family beta-propeller protein